ncbi:MAG: DUF1428 domain-containing protein [Phycisphaerales bacterium]
MSYVDGFVLAVPKKNLAKYRRIARLSATVWRDHGALAFKECVADHLDTGMGLHFEKLVKPKRGETVVFSFVLFKSRAHRDRVNAKAVKDPRLAKLMQKGAMPFDVKRMAYGGFKPLVDA